MIRRQGEAPGPLGLVAENGDMTDTTGLRGSNPFEGGE